MNNGLTKKQSTYLKAIGIFLMFCLHLFSSSDHQVVSISIGANYFSSYFANFARLCVYLFAFTSGYGLFHSYQKGNVLKNTFKRLLIFLLSYWIILFTIFIPFYLIGEQFEILNFVTSIIGHGIINSYGWYVSFYIVMSLSMALIQNILKKSSIFSILVLVFLLCSYILLGYFKRHIPSYNYFANCIFAYISVILGYLFAQKNVFCHLANKIDEKHLPISSISALLLLSSFFVYLRFRNGVLLPFITIFLIILVFALTRKKIAKPLDFVLTQLGNNSQYLWFLHAAILSTYINKIVNIADFFYLPKESFLVVLFSITILMPISLFYKFIIDKLTKKLSR